jgi:hypothetical protein
METLKDAASNYAKLSRVESVWNDVMREVLTRGFYGSALVEVTIQDGTIQFIRRCVERTER